MLVSQPLYIVTGTFVIVGLYFIIVVTFLHGNDGDCGFTITHCSIFYKATGLIMAKIALNCF